MRSHRQTDGRARSVGRSVPFALWRGTMTGHLKVLESCREATVSTRLTLAHGRCRRPPLREHPRLWQEQGRVSIQNQDAIQRAREHREGLSTLHHTYRVYLPSYFARMYLGRHCDGNSAAAAFNRQSFAPKKTLIGLWGGGIRARGKSRSGNNRAMKQRTSPFIARHALHRCRLWRI